MMCGRMTEEGDTEGAFGDTNQRRKFVPHLFMGKIVIFVLS